LEAIKHLVTGWLILENFAAPTKATSEKPAYTGAMSNQVGKKQASRFVSVGYQMKIWEGQAEPRRQW